VETHAFSHEVVLQLVTHAPMFAQDELVAHATSSVQQHWPRQMLQASFPPPAHAAGMVEEQPVPPGVVVQTPTEQVRPVLQVPLLKQAQFSVPVQSLPWDTQMAAAEQVRPVLQVPSNLG
jgi:hypothetical protein